MTHPAPGFPRVAAYSSIRGNGAPLVSADGTLDMARCEGLARYPLVTLDVNGVLNRPDIVPALRRFNPEIRVAGYLLMTHWYLPATFAPAASDVSFNAVWHRAIARTSGFVPDAPGGYEVAWHQEFTADALADLVVYHAASSRLFDSLFMVYCSPRLDWVSATHPAFTAENDVLRLKHFRKLVQRLRAARGRDFSLYGNGTGADLIGLDGTMREGFVGVLTSAGQAMTQAPGDWLKSEGGADAGLARYTLATACMTGAYAAPGGNRTWAEVHESRLWQPEYSLRLGEPTGPPVKLAGSEWWVRGFERGTVSVNHATREGVFLVRAS